MSTTKVHTMPPLQLTAIMHAGWAMQVLRTAVELDLFSALSAAPASAAQAAAQLKLDARGTQLLIDALQAMELVEKSGDGYSPTVVARAYLCRESEFYLGKYISFSSVISDAWTHLTDSVRTGKPQAKVNDQAEGEKFFTELTEAIFPLNYSTAQSLCEELKVAALKGEVRVLDLAAGSAVWSLPMAKANPQVQVDALDFPPVLDVTRRFAAKYGVEKRYQYLPGNWQDVSLQADHYDFILLGHILHSEGKELSQDLLKHCAAALKTGGTLVVAEFLENETRSGPVFATLFALNMMLATARGCVFSEGELKGMIESSGLKEVRRLPLPFWKDQSPVMVARK